MIVNNFQTSQSVKTCKLTFNNRSGGELYYTDADGVARKTTKTGVYDISAGLFFIKFPIASKDEPVITGKITKISELDIYNVFYNVYGDIDITI